MSAQDLTIAVTGLNATENPGPGLGVIRAIREQAGSNVRIIGLAYDPLDPGVYMAEVCDHAYLIPYPSQGAKALSARLEEIHAKTPIDVVVPSLDSELTHFLDLSDKLQRMGIQTFLPTRENLKVCSKENLSALGSSQGIKAPRCVSVTSVSTIYQLSEIFSFPVMVKGRFYGADVAHSPAEVERIFHRLRSEWGLPVLVQEYVIGEEYDIAAVGDGTGGMVGAVPMRKLRLTEKGKAWGGITVSDPAMDECAREVMAEVKWRGPCEMEIIKTRQGEYFLIEINPRFPAWCYLCPRAGQNLPWMTVRLAMGANVEPLPDCLPGVMFLRHSMDMIYPISMLESLTTDGELHGKKAL